MRHILICLLAAAVCFGAGYLPARVARIARPTLGRAGTLLITCGSGIAIVVILSLVYLGIYCRVDEMALTALNGGEGVVVVKTDGGYFFDGSSDDMALVFYPGAKVGWYPTHP